jgi:hypothetical protein
VCIVFGRQEAVRAPLIKSPPPFLPLSPPQLHGTADPPDAESHTLTDPDLLADVMEAREAVADAEPGGAALAALRADYARRADALAATLSAAFGAGDEAAARDAVTRLRYVTRIMQAATDKM